MLVIRLSRVGKQNQAAFRITLSEKTAAVKGANQEILGFYNPCERKRVNFNKERIEYWISKGAKPSDSVASLLKLNGVANMDVYLEPRNKKRRSKSAAKEEAAKPAGPAKSSKPVSSTEAAGKKVEKEATVSASEAAPSEEAAPTEEPASSGDSAPVEASAPSKDPAPSEEAAAS